MNYNISVINLYSRPDRLKMFQDVVDQLQTPVNVLSAVDSIKADKMLAQKEVYADNHWLDPLLDEPIKIGEVGCFLSHFLLWSSCLEQKKPLLIFEDDVHTNEYFDKQSFDKEINNFLNSDADIHYLAWNDMGTGDFYPYWACAYMIKPKAAEKLIQTDILNNLIPTDEYLPLMLGAKPFTDSESLKEHYKRLDKYEKLIYSNSNEQMFKPYPRTVLGSDIEKEY